MRFRRKTIIFSSLYYISLQPLLLDFFKLYFLKIITYFFVIIYCYFKSWRQYLRIKKKSNAANLILEEVFEITFVLKNT